ncbi:DUF3322 domain-containing protein [Desulfosporosinus hippei]|uniref:DUF3322 domain-containing protein n=1 Tax=Desulfosporosinus hippei TaxID=569859 RepID=UPI003CFD7E0B
MENGNRRGVAPEISFPLDRTLFTPRCGLYMRQVDIPGIATKFIEQRKGVFNGTIEYYFA